VPRILNTAVKEGSFYTVLACFVILAAFPFYWMLITAFKTNSDLYDLSNIPFWFNDPPTLEHFRYLFDQTLFVRWLINSLVIGLCVVAITLVTALPAGYTLARLAGRSSEALGIGIFLTYLVPPTILFLPLSRIITMIGLQNSMWSLVLVYPTFTIPFCTWLLMGFFRAVPREIEEAAIVDGCSLFGGFVKMVLPLSLPAILTVIIFTFTLTLQEFVYALTFISASAQKTITLGVATDLVRGDIYYWGELMAGALIASVPVAIAYNLFLDRFIAGSLAVPSSSYIFLSRARAANAAARFSINLGKIRKAALRAGRWRHLTSAGRPKAKSETMGCNHIGRVPVPAKSEIVEAIAQEREVIACSAARCRSFIILKIAYRNGETATVCLDPIERSPILRALKALALELERAAAAPVTIGHLGPQVQVGKMGG
jgi:multiple sugar transport system permease protein